jgi:hypothetical protein
LNVASGRGYHQSADRSPLMRPPLPVALALTFALAALGVAREASAQRAAFRLTVERATGAEPCADEPTLRSSVRERLGYNPFSDGATHSVVLRFQRQNRGYSARLLVASPGRARPAQRRLTSRARACTNLSDAVALAMAIAIDPDAVARTTVSAPRGGGAASMLVGAPSADAVSRWEQRASLGWAPRVIARDARRRERGAQWSALVRVGLWAPGLLPTVRVGSTELSPTVVLGAGAQVQRWSVRVEASATWPALARTVANQEVSLVSAGLALVGCGAPVAWVALCASTHGTLTSAASASLDAIAATVAPGWAIGARAALEPRIARSPVSLAINLEGLLWLVAPSVRVDGQGLWTRPRASAGVELGAIVHF